LKFQIGSNETEILESTFKSTENESESKQSTLKIPKSKELYQEILWNFISFVKHWELL